jgi:hypothetical protein
MSLPAGDKTPLDFFIDKENNKEKFKKNIRKNLYPIYLKIRKKSVEKRFGFIKNMGINELFLGQRGTDYEAQRKRVNQFKVIEDSVVLVVGVGTGRD